MVVLQELSGETSTELLVSQFIHLKGLAKPSPYFGQGILGFSQYDQGISQSDVKFNQDYDALIRYTKSLNEELHGKRIRESQRALLISGILIALRNNGFRAGYANHRTAKSLLEGLYTAIGTELDESTIIPERVAKLKAAFVFIKSHQSLTSKKGKGKEFSEKLISDIDKRINGFRKTNRFFDAVSQFYVEFLHYANQDKSLGIVITPAHICDLFVELADTNKDSVVFDNCAGTGSFLVAAMRNMMQAASGDGTKEESIKSRQIIGIEYQEDIYALAVSNMLLHLDGKTNIIQGDCFDYADELKTFHPTVGLLNPPYKTERSDKEELEYVLNNLDVLEPGSRCVAIIPFSCANNDTTIAQGLKKRLLAKHTLEAVMSLPDELFHDSDVNVITCAIVVTAHKPHPQGKKTWFGYWRNDGFVKVKNKGRIDRDHVWAGIKTRWVNAYRNHDTSDGMAVMKEVDEKSEWCAEAYMETNYSLITQDHYEEAAKKYILFNLMDLTGTATLENNQDDDP